MVISEEHINAGFDQVETIARIHEEADEAAKFEAIKTYQEFLGLTDEASDQLIKRVREFIPASREDRAKAEGWVYIGVVLGLSAASKALESG